jgi:hypothetical protein
VRLKGVDATRAQKGGAYPDAIAALVLLATRYPVAHRQPRSQHAPGCAPGSRKGGWAMRQQRTIGLLAVLAALLVVVLGATAAAAQAPVKETIQVDDTFVDEGLSEACGVEVTVTETGFITFLTFPDRPVGPLELTSYHLDLLLTAGDQQARFRDVGIDLIRIEPDGTAILSIVGQSVPNMFTGVLKFNLDTREVILEPHHTLDVCGALTG